MPLLPSIIRAHPALLIVDMQMGLDEVDFYGGNRNNPCAEEHAARLLSAWRTENLPVIHVQHSSSNPLSPLHVSRPGFKIKDEVYPIENEPVIVKSVNSAFIGTNLQTILSDQGIQQVVIIGMTTNHCVSSTVRSAANLGFKTTIISDATATFDRAGTDGIKYPSTLIHQITLASLNEEFANVRATDEVFVT